jgi:hypothetical protein
MRLQPTQEETAFPGSAADLLPYRYPGSDPERVRAGIEPSYERRWRDPDDAAMSACAAMSRSGEEPTAKSKENR